MKTASANTTKTKALIASELSYCRLFEAAKDGILILDADTGRVTDANPFLIELLGYSLAEMVDKTVGELSPFKNIMANQAMLKQLRVNKYVRYENLPLETKDGRHIAVEFVCNVYQAGDQEVVQCNIRDITRRRRMEKQLRESEAKFRGLFDGAKDGIFLIRNSLFVDCNARGEELLGRTRDQIIGQLPSSFAPQSSQMAVTRAKKWWNWSNTRLRRNHRHTSGCTSASMAHRLSRISALTDWN